MACKLQKTGFLPDLVASCKKPRTSHGCPSAASGFEGEKRCMRGNDGVGRNMVIECGDRVGDVVDPRQDNLGAGAECCF